LAATEGDPDREDRTGSGSVDPDVAAAANREELLAAVSQLERDFEQLHQLVARNYGNVRRIITVPYRLPDAAPIRSATHPLDSTWTPLACSLTSRLQDASITHPARTLGVCLPTHLGCASTDMPSHMSASNSPFARNDLCEVAHCQPCVLLRTHAHTHTHNTHTHTHTRTRIHSLAFLPPAPW